MKNKGFSTTELLTSVAIVGILGALGVGAYTFYIPKAQSKEASQMMMHQMLELSNQVIKGACTANGNPLSIKGEYGTLLVSGTPVNSPGSSCPSGCNMRYTFGGVGVHNQLNGKVFVVDALNNGKLSQANGTTLPEKYWPAGISKLPVNAGESCTSITKTAPSTTDGSVSGTEVGDAEPAPPSPPTPTNPTPPTPTNPTPPTESTPPSPPSPPPPSTGEVVNTAVATVNTPIVAYFFCERSCTFFNYLIDVADHKPATMVIDDGNTVDLNGLGFTLGIANMNGLDGETSGIYGLTPQLKNPGDAPLLNQYSKVKVKISAPDGTSVDGYFNKLANNVWSDSGYLSVMRSRYGSTKFDPTGQLWVDLRNMIKTKGVAYAGVGYRINSAKITYEFIK